jgi:hypothetical protein
VTQKIGGKFMMAKSFRYFLFGALFFLLLNFAYAIDENVDKELKTIWRDMKSALINKNIEKAVEYYHAETKENYRDIYTAFGDKLPQIVRDLGDIQSIYIRENEAKYRLLKKETYGGKIVDITYSVYFIKDSDGKWKILRY